MAIDPQRQKRRRTTSPAIWCAVLVFGFVAGSALVLLTDSDPDTTAVSASPTVTGDTTSTAAASSTAGGVTDVNGQSVRETVNMDGTGARFGLQWAF